MSELAQHATDYEIVEGEPPELLGRNLSSAGHLLASATAFFFLAFVFAYFYLRSLNNAGLWRPKHVDPVADARHARHGRRRGQRRARPAGGSPTTAPRAAPQWRLKGALALAIGVAVRRRSRSSSGRRSGSGRPTAATRACSSAGRRSTSSSSSARSSGSRRLLATAIRYREAPGRRQSAAPGEASGDPRPPRPRHRRPALARAARPRGAVLLLGVPRRARRPRLDRPLPRSSRGGRDAPCRS